MGRLRGRSSLLLALGTGGILWAAAATPVAAASAAGGALSPGGALAAGDQLPTALDAAEAEAASAAAVPASAGPLLLAGPLKTAAASRRLTVFGDSYSQVPRRSFPNWVSQLKADRVISSFTDYAKSATFAADIGPNTFARQLRLWQRAGASTSGDVVVYLGYNDISDLSGSFARSRAGYESGINTLLDAGAGGRLFLVMPHDVGSVPLYNGSRATARRYRQRTIAWDREVAGITRAHRGKVTAIDLFTVIDRVLAHPAAYGFTDITTVDHHHSATTALYDDPFHFGEHGQRIIEQTIAGYLNRRAVAAKALRLSRQVQLRAATDAGEGLAFGLDLLPESTDAAAAGSGTPGLGLTVFPVGRAPFAGASLLTADTTGAAAGDRPPLSQFELAYLPDQRQGGVGLGYGLSRDTRLGLVLTRYDAADRSGLEAGGRGSDGAKLSSEGTAFLLRHRAGRFELDTSLAYSRDRHETEQYDALTGSHDRAAFDGRTAGLSQRVSLPLRVAAAATLTPWAELAYQRQEVDGFTLESPYLSDQHYAGDTIADSTAALGLEGRLAPIALGESGTLLSLRGGLSYTYGLASDDYHLRVREAAFGNVQEETIERPEARTLGLSLGGSLAFGPDLALDGGILLEHDLVTGTGTAEAARLGLDWRF